MDGGDCTELGEFGRTGGAGATKLGVKLKVVIGFVVVVVVVGVVVKVGDNAVGVDEEEVGKW